MKIDYEELEPVRALRTRSERTLEGTFQRKPLSDRHVVAATQPPALAESKYTVTNSFRTPFTEHAFLGSAPLPSRTRTALRFLSTDQGAFDTRKRLRSCLAGAGAHCGGKTSSSAAVSVERGCVCAAYRGTGGMEDTKFPVKAKFTRQESLIFSIRSAMLWKVPSPWAVMRMVSSPVWTVRSQLRYRCLCISLRTGSGACMYPLRRTVLLPEYRYPRLWLLYQ